MQELDVLYQVYVLRTDRKTKMAAMASEWLRHLRVRLCNRWAETWQEARSQRPVFRPIGKPRPDLWLADIFSTSLQTLNRIVFFGLIEKPRLLSDISLAEAFRLLLRNRWREFDETLQEESTVCPLTILCFFFGRSINENNGPGGSVNIGGTLYSDARFVPFGLLVNSVPTETYTCLSLWSLNLYYTIHLCIMLLVGTFLFCFH